MTSFMDSPEEKRRQGARREAQSAIARLVTDDDPDAFEIRPWGPGANPALSMLRHPLALPGLAAARRLAIAAETAERQAIEHARGQGKTWTDIGRALGKGFIDAAKRADMGLSLAAWRYAAFRVMPDEEIPWRPFSGEDGARWQCWTCTGYVTETHPDNGRDRESGHKPGCARGSRR